MLKEIAHSSRAKNSEIAEHMEMLSPALSRVLACKVYMNPKYYDKLYDYIDKTGGKSPRRRGVVCYPSGKAKGTWDVYIDGQFASTLPFVNHYDLFNFLNEKDMRLNLLRNFFELGKETVFNNKVIEGGKRIKGRDF